ncbi:MAG: hypothetical protein HOM11_17575 [Methylococcales bacterium]|jgi:uncharacterized protein|nr:hypothetical protein [Methylococcales bacterium]MBT7443137.1 hypothetical protein [Methylococcales bacterium]
MTPSISINALQWFLIVQALFGAFDSFWNHEWQAKLPYQVSARLEQRLHALREFIYAVLFMGLAWFVWGGVYAWVLVSFLLLESVITAWDFVEEDRSRKLSPQERVTHLILTLNFGAFMALALPHFLQWSERPSELVLQTSSLASIIMTFFSISVLALGIRNWMSANKLNLQAKEGLS